MNILITGSSGFVGAHLVRALSDNHTIYGLDKYNAEYIGFKKIHRGKQGLQDINEIEEGHRIVAWRHRQEITEDRYIQIPDWAFSFESFESPDKPVDLIINCGSLSEAILSQYYKEFTFNSIMKGLQNLKKRFPNVPIMHFSSSMVYGTWTGAITEKAPINPESYYGECKANSEFLCDLKQDIILRPIHVFGWGDGKFPIWMNIERQIKANKPVSVEAADCIYIKEMVAIVEKIVDNWVPGTYNISSGFVRDGKILQKIYPKNFEYINKLGPTGKARGSLDSTKLRETFDLSPMYTSYEQMIEDYYSIYESHWTTCTS